MTQTLRGAAGDPVRASWIARLKAGARVTVAAGLAAVFLALVGAFGTGEHAIAFRLAYWLGMILTGTAMAYAVAVLVSRIVDKTGRPWLFGAIVTVILAGLITGVLVAFWSILLASPVPVSGLPKLYAQAFVITAAMMAYITAVQYWPRRANGSPTAAITPSRFMERLPHRLRGAALLAVAAEDHYLRVYTDQGDALILLRLSDAIAELGKIDGARTHRSWWVARSALVDIERNERRFLLVLTNGVKAPVSRTHAPALRRLRWL